MFELSPRRAAGLLLPVAVAITGCYERSARLNAPPQGDTSRPSQLQAYFVYMTDNAMLLDASIADIHFEPNTAELSGLGVRRLTRMAELLSVCGGTVRYEASQEGDDLIEARLETVRGFLASSGFDADAIQVESGPPRSQQLAAVEALEISARGVANPEAAGAGGTGGMPPAGSPR